MMEAAGYPVQVIRSRRKTISVQVKGDYLLVKAPLSTRDSEIREFLGKHERWIKIHMGRTARNVRAADEAGALSLEEIKELADRALAYIPPRVEYYARMMGVTYGRITIRNQKSRWGSCSAKGNLNFNCLLMLCPEQVIDSVVVHELAHRKEMNHSQRFYREVLQVYPDYPACEKWLKENGGVLLRRMAGGM